MKNKNWNVGLKYKIGGLFLAFSLLVSQNTSGQSMATLLKQAKDATNIINEIADYEFLIAEGANIVELIELNAKKMAMMEKKREEIVRQLDSKAWKEFERHFGKQMSVRDALKLLNLRIHTMVNVGSSIARLCYNFKSAVLKESVSSLEAAAAVAADVAAKSGVTASGVGAITMFVDPLPVVNAVTLAKLKEAKDRAKEFLVALSSMLNELNDFFEKVYVDVTNLYDIVAMQVRRGTLYLGKNTYTYSDGSYKLIKFEYEVLIKEAEERDQDALRGCAGELLQGKKLGGYVK